MAGDRISSHRLDVSGHAQSMRFKQAGKQARAEPERCNTDISADRPVQGSDPMVGGAMLDLTVWFCPCSLMQHPAPTWRPRNQTVQKQDAKFRAPNLGRGRGTEDDQAAVDMKPASRSIISEPGSFQSLWLEWSMVAVRGKNPV